MIFTLTFAICCIVHVTVDVLFPVTFSTLVVLIFAVLTNVYHHMSSVPNVPVSVIVHPLPAGSVQMLNVLTGMVMFAGTTSLMTTLLAGWPQLFPYVMV